LKERLLGHFPTMRDQGCGRDVTLAFQDSIGAAISKACAADCYQDSQHLAEAAEIVRRDMFAAHCNFTGTFSSSCQNDSVPVFACKHDT